MYQWHVIVGRDADHTCITLCTSRLSSSEAAPYSDDWMGDAGTSASMPPAAPDLADIDALGEGARGSEGARGGEDAWLGRARERDATLAGGAFTYVPATGASPALVLAV